MATVVLQYVGSAIGTIIGGPIGSMIGRAAGAIAGNLIDQVLLGGGPRRIEGPRLTDLRVMSSSEGAPVPRLYGRMRVAGQVIWATRLEEVVSTDSSKGSAKGGGGATSTKVTKYEYYANFAVAVCEGEIDRIGRAWADGKEIDLSDYTWRLYRGTETQNPDSLIVAKQGAGNTPAYRGIAYLVFEHMPVSRFGNRLPQLSFEVIRAAGGAETHVRAVNIIPGTTEFGYATTVVNRDMGNGVTESENAHAMAGRSDFQVAIDDLAATCPNLEAAALVVAWFGTDLRCGSTEIRPGVETATKLTSPDTWKVAGLTRSAVHLVSQSGGHAAFGGTPSDKAVIDAIQDLRSRGLKVVFDPFLMMDIPAGNGLADPYGGSEQAAYPWRGRITCHPAPGRSGSPDKSAACLTEINSFVGTAAPSDFTAATDTVTYSGPAEWSYRRMILHYAKLCALAGGVDAFLIGSELRGLTTLRSSPSAYPFVAALVDLAADVKSILPAAKVSYGADWSEYFGHQPQDGSGDVFFHLDPLWASTDIDFIGIDNYMPASDWRDGYLHADRLAGFTSIYDRDYLAANIAGGEGFDWYYASGADRNAQERTSISDGAYGKPWVFRYKDLKSWWLNRHYNRPGGVQSASHTAWVPQSKPFWFTEVGCPAVDKGTNQPNVFYDPKSSESALPYYSSGRRDDFIQNRFVEVFDGYWQGASAANPISSVYGGTMVEAGRSFLWAWDARPFPYFPVRTDIWADGANYARGHWLNGRIGAIPLSQLIVSICASFGFDDADVSEVEGLVDGFLIDRVMSAREAIEGLLSTFAIDAVEHEGKLKFRMRRSQPVAALVRDELVETDAAASLFQLARAQETELPAAIKLSYLETAADYRIATVESRRAASGSARETTAALACATGQATAQVRADIALQEIWAGRDSFEFALPPSRIDLEPGDVVTLALATGPRDLRLEQISDGTFRRLRSRHFEGAVYDPPDAPTRDHALWTPPVFGKPDALFLDLPIAQAGVSAHAPWIAASARPWPGSLGLLKETSAASLVLNREIEAQSTKGLLTGAFPAGPLRVFDRASDLTVKLDFGALSSVSEEELLLGANIAAVGLPATGWEIIQFATAELIASKTYRLTVLLRGQSGSEPEMLASRPANTRFVLLNGAVVQPVLSLAEAALQSKWRVGPTPYDPARAYTLLTSSGKMLGLRPLTPCQLRALRDGGDVVFSWIRRTRIDGDSWEVTEVPLGEDSESYTVEVLDGATVKRSLTTTAPTFRYDAAAIAADFGTAPSTFTLRIAQVSATYGPGAALQRTLHV